MMRKVARERGIRLSKRIVELCRYLREEAEEFYLEEKLMKFGSMIGSCMIRLEFTEDETEYIDVLQQAALSVMNTRMWLEITAERGLIEDRTFISLRRECLDMTTILMRKTKTVAEEIGLWDDAEEDDFISDEDSLAF